MRSNWKPMRKYSTEGAYDFIKQLVTLDSVELPHFRALGDKAMQAVERRVLRVLFHEAVHWLDHASTVWGQRSVVQILNAINARLRNVPEEFWRIALANSEVCRIKFPGFFTVKEEGVETEWRGRPWTARITSGLQFGPDGRLRKDRPIMFYRFMNAEGEYICRTPVSISAILESNATAAESWVDLKYLSGLDNDERLVAGSLLGKEAIGRLYDPVLSEYAVMAHLVANKLGIEDGFDANRLASCLGTLALNLPPKSFHGLRVPEAYRFEGRFKAFVKACDRGFAFVVLLAHAPRVDSQELWGGRLREWVDKTLAAAGLQGLAEFEKNARAEQELIASEVIDGPEAPRAEAILKVGRRLYERRGVYGCDPVMQPLLDGETLVDLPAVVLGDFNLVQIGTAPSEIPPADVSRWVRNVERYERDIDEFVDACLP